ncbi:hypothetical protein BgiMline_020429 [Biomphalaria glabrata]|nr:hypothetical protein BgiMline_017631 [Biomphalaria glabrata]
MAHLFLILGIFFVNLHFTEPQLFMCSRPEYDVLETTAVNECLLSMCVHCKTKISYQELNYTLAVKINETVWTLDKDNALYSTQDNLTQITFPFNDSLGFSLFDGPVQFQFSMSALEEDGNVTNETNPWTAPEQFKAPDFVCGSPDYDRSENPRNEVCRRNLCLECFSNATYQQINSQLAYKVKEHVYVSLGKQISTEDNKTRITFLFSHMPRVSLAHDGPMHYQFSVSVLDNDFRWRKEISPLSEPFKYNTATEIYFSINGKNDSVVVVEDTVLSFLGKTNGYPPPVLDLRPQGTLMDFYLFDDIILQDNIPFNKTIHNHLVDGSFSCSTYDVHQEKKIFVLSRSQFRLYGYVSNAQDVDVQWVSYLKFKPDYVATISVYGYPAPKTMVLSSNGKNITDGVNLIYIPDKNRQAFGTIKVYFAYQALLEKYASFNMTVNNGRLAIFTFDCADCDEPSPVHSDLSTSSVTLHWIIVLSFFVYRVSC